MHRIWKAQWGQRVSCQIRNGPARKTVSAVPEHIRDRAPEAAVC